MRDFLPLVERRALETSASHFISMEGSGLGLEQPPLKAGRAGGPCGVTLLSSWASHLSSSSPAGPRLSPAPVKSC